MIRGIHHLTLVVRDTDAAVQYYAAAGGLHCQSSEGAVALALSLHQVAGADAHFTPVLLAGPNGYLLLAGIGGPKAQTTDANPINRVGIRHLCVQNHDCAILNAGVYRGGGSLIAPPVDLGTGNQYAYARDVEANIMEIEGLPYAPADEPTWLAHVALVTRNLDQTCAFYQGLFETQLKRRAKVGPGAQFDRMGGLRETVLEGAWLPAGNLQLELWQFHQPPSPDEPRPRTVLDPGYSMMSLECDDLERDVARLIDLGGIRIRTLAESNLARAAVCADPEGNLVELIEFKTAGRTWAIAHVT